MSESKPGALPPAAYVNFLRVAHNRSEFFLAFGQLAQETPGGAHLLASLVTSPAHAKAMLAALQDAVTRHEERFGVIEQLEPRPAAAARPGAAPPRREKGSRREGGPQSQTG